MSNRIDLLAIQTPENLRKGQEHQTRFHCGAFEVLIFETFKSSTKIKICYEGLSVSSMIRGYKTVFTKEGEVFKFKPGTSLILADKETIFADFPEADIKNPVQCATILISKDSLNQQLQFLNTNYPTDEQWSIDFSNFHFNNNSGLVRTFNELLQVVMQQQPNHALTDLLLKSLLIRIIESQKEHQIQKNSVEINNKFLEIKRFISENISLTLNTEELTKVGNCSKSTLHRMFENYCGKTPGAYILQQRMNSARHLLLQANSNISEVAYKVGFSSLSYFVKQFKMYHNCTPGDYIKKFKH